MGSNLNLKNTGPRPPGEMIAGAADFPLTRQQHPSIYSLTFEEFQTTVAGAGKDLGSMNMDELLKNIWSADENHTTGGDRELQRQGSLTLPRTLSSKTVDEVWQTMSSKEAADHRARGFCFYPPTLGEVTLEEFLVRAGVVREAAAGDHQPPDAAGLFSDFPCIVGSSGSGYGFGFGESGLTQSPQPRILPKQPNPDPATSNTVITRSLAAVVSSDTYTFNGGLRGRKSTAALEKVVERRHRRMIKNRESAARSRERKQAYTMELEAEVAKLKEENASLQKRQEKLLEIQKKQAVEMANQRNRSKRRCLRRTQTCPIVASIRAHQRTRGGRHIFF